MTDDPLDLIQEIGRAGVEWDGARNYATVQIDRETWRAILRLTPHTHSAGTLVGKHIDECAKCGLDIRSDVHSSRTPSPPARP